MRLRDTVFVLGCDAIHKRRQRPARDQHCANAVFVQRKVKTNAFDDDEGRTPAPKSVNEKSAG